MGKRVNSEAAGIVGEGEPLPTGWCWATVGEICQLINGRAFKPQEWEQRGLPIIRIQNLNNIDAPFNHFAGELDDRHRVQTGDLLFAWSGTPGTSFGAHIWSRGAAALNQHIFKVIEQGCVTRAFLMRALNFRLDQLISLAHGGAGLAHVTKPMLETTLVPLPPLAEQRRIVAKLEALLGRIRRAREALDAVPAMVERYKKSVLGAAFQNVTGEDYRDHVDVLSRQTLRVPKRWAVQTLKDCTDPRRPICYGVVQPGDQVADGPRMIRVLDIGDDLSIDGLRLRTVAPSVDAAFSRSRVRTGDVLVTVVGTIGRVGVVEEALDGVNIARAVARVAPTADVSPRWIAWWMSSPWMCEWLSSSAVEVARATLNLKELSRAYVPVPPLDEQRAIVERIDAAFARARSMLAAAESARAQLDTLERSLLAKAFRGELVEQDPSDEPASVMLDRVRAERAKADAPAKKPRKPRGESAPSTPTEEPARVGPPPTAARRPKPVPDSLAAARAGRAATGTHAVLSAYAKPSHRKR
jgi:type I restriction enzyme S subunit